MIKGIDYPEWYSQESLDTVLRGYVFENETPKQMYQRLAKTLSLRYADMLSKTSTTVTNQWDPLQMESVWFDYMWKGWLSPASPLLSNLGTTRGFPISCLTGDSWVNTRKDGKQIRDIQIGDEVLTHKGRYRKVIDIQSRQCKDDLYEIKVGTRLTPIKITGNHPVLTNVGWVRVDELKEKEHLIATNREIETVESAYSIRFDNQRKGKIVNDVLVNNDVAWFLGLWFAEGSISKDNNKLPNGIRVTLSVDEKEYAERFLKIAKDEFDLNGNIYESDRERISKSRTNNGHRKGKWLTVNINGTNLGEYFLTEFGKNCKVKEIPQWIIDLPKEQLESFFDAFLLGDGSKYENKNKCTLSNPKLVLSLYNISLKLGKEVSLQMQEKASKQSTTAHVYTIVVRNTTRSTMLASSNAGIKFNDGLTYCPIKYIKKLDYNTEVFDLTVEEDHSFSVSGVVVHNCFGLRIADNTYDIFTKVREMSILTKYGGGK